jgi:hypothetical protein
MGRLFTPNVGATVRNVSFQSTAVIVQTGQTDDIEGGLLATKKAVRRQAR